jgi:hypothetical protein
MGTVRSSTIRLGCAGSHGKIGIRNILVEKLACRAVCRCFAKIEREQVGPWGNRATLAQLVERLIRNQQVAGSIPAGGSRKSVICIGRLVFCPSKTHPKLTRSARVCLPLHPAFASVREDPAPTQLPLL